MRTAQRGKTAITLFGTIIILAALILSGCPNPEADLFFLIEGKQTQQVKLKLGPARANFSVWGQYRESDSTYWVNLWSWDLKTRSDKDTLVYDFGSAQVWVADRQMACRGRRGVFSIPLSLDAIPRDTSGHWLPLPVKIYLGDSYRLNGQPIAVDALYAIDKKTDGLERYLPRKNEGIK